MRTPPLLRWAVLCGLMAAGTWFFGWWAIPLLAGAWGLILRPDASWPGGSAAATAWGAIMATTPWEDLRRLAHRLGGVLGLSGLEIFAFTLAVGWLLGWSGARVGAGVGRALRAGGRNPDRMPGTGSPAADRLN